MCLTGGATSSRPLSGTWRSNWSSWQKTARPVKKEHAGLMGKNHAQLSVRTQCELLEVPRSSLDCRPVGESEEDRGLMRLMDGICLIDPCIGTRRLVQVQERDHRRKVNRKRLREAAPGE